MIKKEYARDANKEGRKSRILSQKQGRNKPLQKTCWEQKKVNYLSQYLILELYILTGEATLEKIQEPIIYSWHWILDERYLTLDA